VQANWEGVLRHFERAGLSARVIVPRRRMFGSVASVRIDPQRGEFFALCPDPEEDPTLLEASARRHHLLLLIVGPASRRRLLFGHDERHLFVARLPQDARVSRLAGAFDALKPAEVLAAETAGLEPLRQGEWFFIPAPGFQPDRGVIVQRKVPLRPIGRFEKYPRAHVANELVRLVQSTETPARQRLLVYVRGAVRHGDHRTVHLTTWHRVLPNREAGPLRAFSLPGSKERID
jgi:hypothetical protein